MGKLMLNGDEVGMPDRSVTAGGVSYDNTTSGLSATEVQSAIDELADKSKFLVQKASFNITGVSGDWVYKSITFPTAYKSAPMVSVYQYSTVYATNWYPPMIDNISATGFRVGWYNAGAATRTFLWQAAGITV